MCFKYAIFARWRHCTTTIDEYPFVFPFISKFGNHNEIQITNGPNVQRKAKP